MQYSYDPYIHECNTKKLEVEDISDYLMSYVGKDGRRYDTMSLKYIKMSKEKTNRPKDKKDIKKINQFEIREDVYSRLHMFRQVSKIKAVSINKSKNKEKEH